MTERLLLESFLVVHLNICAKIVWFIIVFLRKSFFCTEYCRKPVDNTYLVKYTSLLKTSNFYGPIYFDVAIVYEDINLDDEQCIIFLNSLNVACFF